ncbi:shikimate kinase [Alphaproteobacteria bacterium]|nr:shikimate kinase [Alphaproteobacteria bacterium]MDC0148339.1 shikimate kinase [Alphaproteobacteria bacterium]MDC1241086.1 shikimate kinase [bacterium]
MSIGKKKNSETFDVTRPIVLIGMMGAGKSSLGKRLAAVLGLAFRDADDKIEEAANMSIAEIFKTHGEAAFRDGEQRVIARLLQDGPQILALGGGAFLNPTTRELIQQTATSVWLDAELDELVDRVQRKPGKRPLLVGTDIRAKLQQLMNERGPVYAEAHMRVNITRTDHKASVKAIRKALHEHFTQPAEEGQS